MFDTSFFLLQQQICDHKNKEPYFWAELNLETKKRKMGR